MSRDMRIEEMALALAEGGCGKKCDCIEVDKFNCHFLHSASVLYNAGYRKASEVAREIFEEIEENVFKYRSPYGESHRNTVVLTEKCFYELKKKYESEGADDDTKPN